MVDEDSSTPSLLPITTALASDFSSKIQKALAQGSANTRSASDIASILGVSKSNLSKTLKLAPAGIKSSNGKISLSKLNKFLSKNSKNTTLLEGKPTKKRNKKQ
jgi:hypothetical protein